MHVIRGTIHLFLFYSETHIRLFQVFFLARSFHWKAFYHRCKEQSKANSYPLHPIYHLISSAFTQLLQQTGVMNQLRQANRPYTLFIPTNAALSTINPSIDINRLRQVQCTFLTHEKTKIFHFILIVCSTSYLR